jgi:signal transduction histidine kinase
MRSANHIRDDSHGRVPAARADERERSRLSRELHDDIAQRIALLTADLWRLRQRLEAAPQPIRDHIDRLSADTAAIGSDLHRITHGLHPASLERLGLAACLRRHCAQAVESRGLAVTMEIGDLPVLDMDTALGVYRIAQEALHNVLKHSGVKDATVTLAAVSDHVLLRVVDRGVGFDPNQRPHPDGLGLITMRERAVLAGGELRILSTPGFGTTVEVRVPIA